MKKLLLLLIVVSCCSGFVLAGNLYKVEIHSKTDARRLAATGVESIVRLEDGYLVPVKTHISIAAGTQDLRLQLCERTLSTNL